MKRIIALAFFLAFIQFPVAWVMPYLRPETLPTAFYLAAALTLLEGTGSLELRTALLLALTVWQGFVRSDVPFVFGVTLIIASLINSSISSFGTCRFNILRGMTIAGISAAIQLYLQFVRYPHLSYPPGTNVNNFLFNFGMHFFSNFILGLLPVFLLVAMLVIRRPVLDAVDVVVLLASAIYLPLWFTVGVVSEVRLYVPFLLALSVVAAKVSAAMLLNQPSQRGARQQTITPRSTLSQEICR